MLWLRPSVFIRTKQKVLIRIALLHVIFCHEQNKDVPGAKLILTFEPMLSANPKWNLSIALDLFPRTTANRFFIPKQSPILTFPCEIFLLLFDLTATK